MDIKITVDKRTEIMEVLLKLTDYFDILPNLNVNYPLPYIKDVEEYFAPLKNHKAVKLLQEVLDTKSFNYDAPIDIALQLNPDFTVGALKGYPFEDRLNKSEKVLAFLKEIKIFAKDANFEAFYNSHIDTYNKWIEETKAKVDTSVIDYLNYFYKEKQKTNYVINLLPLQTRCNYGSKVNNQSICSLGIKINPNKSPSVFFVTNNGSPYLIHHEFSHPIINPLTAKYCNIDKMPPLPKQISKILKSHAYGSNKTYINEQVIRATTILYLSDKHISDYDVEQAIKVEEEQGFIHTRRILNALEIYQNQDVPMSKYYPKILEEFYKPLEYIPDNQKNN